MQFAPHTVPVPRARPRRAVTVVELLVALAILMILSGASILLYFRFFQVSLVSSTALKIQKTLTTARTHAIQSRAPSQVSFWLDNPSFWIDELDAAGQITAPKITNPEAVGDFVRLVSVDKGGASTALGVETIRFEPDGSAEDAAIHLALANPGPDNAGESTTIKVYGPTGQVRVIENRNQ